MFCTKCGKPLPEDAQFCMGCGERISHSESQSKSESESNLESENVKTVQSQNDIPFSHRLAIAGLIVGIIFIGTYILINNMPNWGNSDSGGDTYQNAEYADGDFGDDTAAYFNNDTITNCLWTYMDTLLNDDYDTYLRITNQTDSEEAKQNFNKSKEGYVGLTPNAITIEEGTDTFFGQLTRYCIPEYHEDGSIVKDWRGERQIFGRLKVDEIDEKYYVTAHYRADPFE